ncbi:hypothetical protein QX223_22120 [Vibrio vulnificus]|uniref:hypothetical protein n=1 Tax=Vibrio vulnificus TaxID=672 RepID=UPI00287A3F2F|nr:hypothetical protein [Vibrio vulnificus]MDS1828970.1 hypothetical protein [Vibrio vulnificus]
MVEWLAKVFSSPSEQATLFSILVSTALALSVLALNQWFSRSRDKRQLKINKLEELSVSVYRYERECLEILSRLYQLPSTNQETLTKLTQTVEVADTIEMLCSLYFPNITFDAAKTQSMLLVIYKQAEYIEENQPLDIYHPYTTSSEKVRGILGDLKEQIHTEMVKHT